MKFKRFSLSDFWTQIFVTKKKYLDMDLLSDRDLEKLLFETCLHCPESVPGRNERGNQGLRF